MSIFASTLRIVGNAEVRPMNVKGGAPAGESDVKTPHVAFLYHNVGRYFVLVNILSIM